MAKLMMISPIKTLVAMLIILPLETSEDDVEWHEDQWFERYELAQGQEYTNEASSGIIGTPFRVADLPSANKSRDVYRISNPPKTFNRKSPLDLEELGFSFATKKHIDDFTLEGAVEMASYFQDPDEMSQYFMASYRENKKLAVCSRGRREKEVKKFWNLVGDIVKQDKYWFNPSIDWQEGVVRSVSYSMFIPDDEGNLLQKISGSPQDAEEKVALMKYFSIERSKPASGKKSEKEDCNFMTKLIQTLLFKALVMMLIILQLGASEDNVEWHEDQWFEKYELAQGQEYTNGASSEIIGTPFKWRIYPQPLNLGKFIKSQKFLSLSIEVRPWNYILRIVSP